MIMLYFSGTGNSKYIAELFSQTMGAACYSIEENRDFTHLIAEEGTIAFCYPVYCSRVPRIMSEFTAKYQKPLENKKVIILCTQMMFSGDGARAFTDSFPRGFLNVIFAEHITMPNNICNIAVLPLAKENKARECVLRARQKVQDICDEIKAGKIRKRGFNPGSRALGLIQGVFYPPFKRTSLGRIWIDGDCDLCLLCVSACPMANFQLENGELSTKGNCMACCRCINLCPKKAIAVYLRTKVKKQYRGVDVIL